MDEVVFGDMSEIMGVRERGGAVDVEVGIGRDLVADPAHPDPAHRHDTGARLQAGFGGVDHGGVDGEPLAHR